MYYKHLASITRRSDVVRLYALKALSCSESELRLKLAGLYAINKELAHEVHDSILQILASKRKVAVV